MADLTWTMVTSLAIADSVNPCALAVLFMILISIMIYNPNKKSKVLLAGLAFTFSVFLMYLVYGAVIITLFTSVNNTLSSISPYIYKGFGAFAIILGLLGIKDYLWYKPGTIGTEMPLMLRPKVKRILSEVTSIKGACIAGIFVTLFLLPCTIGPYLIFGSIISQNLNLADKITAIKDVFPWLLYYNFIFVLPMIAITLLVYFGITSVENAQQWKDRNIKVLHLIAGIILVILGIAMFGGWV